MSDASCACQAGVGRDEKAIREYIQRQEEEDRQLDQGKMFD